jgi:hypothetical protein
VADVPTEEGAAEEEEEGTRGRGAKRECINRGSHTRTPAYLLVWRTECGVRECSEFRVACTRCEPNLVEGSFEQQASPLVHRASTTQRAASSRGVDTQAHRNLLGSSSLHSPAASCSLVRGARCALVDKSDWEIPLLHGGFSRSVPVPRISVLSLRALVACWRTHAHDECTRTHALPQSTLRVRSSHRLHRSRRPSHRPN